MENKIFLFAFLLSMIAVAGTWAQNLPAFPGITDSKHNWASSLWTSPQSATTEGRYRSNADDFIRPDSYAGVKFDKWFGMASFSSMGVGIEEMVSTIGFATKVNNLYIGALYTGNLWTNIKFNNYKKRKFDTAPTGGVDGNTYNDYGSIDVSMEPGNNIALLIGVADMGFRLTFRTNYQAFKENNIVLGSDLTGYQLYKSYETDKGYLAPQIAWAMAKDLTANGIRPYASVDLVFYREYEKAETSGPYTPDPINAPTVKFTGKRVINSQNHFDPSLAAGLGGYTLYNKDSFKLSCDIDYVLTFNIYNNEYCYTDENGVYKIGKIQGTFGGNINPFIERSFVSNSLTPSLSGSWSKDNVALKLKLNLALMLSTRKQNSATLNSENKLVYSGLSATNTAFIFRPDLRLAMQYKIVPNRLTLNIGARIQATALTLETSEQKTYDSDGHLNGKEKILQNSVAEKASTQYINRFSIGPTFNFTDNIWVEASTGVTNAFGYGAVNVFSTGENGLFSFGSILFALKF